MAGFEGSRDPEAPGAGASKLPSWAVTRPAPPPPSPLAEGAPPPAEPPPGGSVERPVVQVPSHPFDVDDPFGDKLGDPSASWNRPPGDDAVVRVVDLADEFELTTVEALEVCARAGLEAASGAVWLTEDEAAAFRAEAAVFDRSEAAADAAVPVPPAGGGGLGDRGAQVVPGATLLTPRPRIDDEDEDRPRSRLLRVLVLLVALAVAAAVVVALFTS